MFHKKFRKVSFTLLGRPAIHGFREFSIVSHRWRAFAHHDCAQASVLDNDPSILPHAPTVNRTR